MGVWNLIETIEKWDPVFPPVQGMHNPNNLHRDDLPFRQEYRNDYIRERLTVRVIT